ncbi:thiol-activated cytolysin family protein [Sphingobacterium sp. UGAL515B_05]|uniref:thiol-activated cytolysin family protein n=1 Tax=Sphingobacterium sp. UGAL515B_05 TaxID=2986767 RepID=UPI00295387AD|nr:thiol-activated cytolysin family protein [Sphingobacterium sp. UGAL515B_05]WON97146.1 thiol-activated cytolysin family protein [Sphingobacterium sp. UGAL515B_05]
MKSRTNYFLQRIIKGVPLLLMLFLAASCSKLDSDLNGANGKQALDQLRIPKIQGFTVDSKSNPDNNSSAKRSSGGKRADVTIPPDEDNPFKPKAGSGGYKDGPGIIVNGSNTSTPDPNKLYFYQKYKSQMFTISDQSMGLNIYPGAILRGQSIEGIFSPQMLTGISNNIRPITISTSMPVSGSAVARTSLPRPTSQAALYNAALTDLENTNPGEVGAASLIVEMDTFRVYEELKTIYGFNKGLDAFLINTNTTQQGENHLIASTSAIKIKFFQHNFTIDMDVPQNNTQLFDPTGLDMQAITGGVTPVYVKSVTYGRMGIMVIESSYSSTKLYNAVYKQLGILKNLIGIGTSLTNEEKNIINSATIKVKYTGIGTDTSPAVAVAGLNGFIQVLSANTTYSKASPGVPIAFQLAYLNSGNGLVEAPFQINYGPFDKPYVRIEYKNSNWEANSSSNPKFTYSDIYMSFYKDPTANRKYSDAPIFIDYKYERDYGTKSTYNWVGNWSTSKVTDNVIWKYPGSDQLIENYKVFYFVHYGSDATTSRDYCHFDMVPSENYHVLPKKVDHYMANRSDEMYP